MQTLKFHHVGIPTARKLPDRDYSPALKMHGSGYFDTPYGVEWHNFDHDNPLPEIIQTKPHIAFEVKDLRAAIAGKDIVLPPTQPADGVQVAFIRDRGILVELLQFDRPAEEVWPHPNKFRI